MTLSFELSPLQKSIINASLSSARNYYITQAVYKLSVNLAPEQFKYSCFSFIKSNPYLLGFFRDEKLFLPEKIDWESFPFYEYDLQSAVDINKKDDTLKEILEKDAVRGFEVLGGVLLRFSVINLSKNTSYVVFTHHHALLDGASFSKIIKEIFKNYFSVIRNSALTCEIRKFNFFNYSMVAPALESETRYWKEEIKKFQRLDVIVKRPKEIEDSLFSNKVISIDGETSEKISKICRLNNVSENSFFQSIIAGVLSKYYFSKKITMGVTRRFPSKLIEDCLGVLINVLPVNFEIELGDTFFSLLKETKEKLESLKNNLNYFLLNKDISENLNINFDVLYDYKDFDILEDLKLIFGGNLQEAYFNVKTDCPLTFEVVKKSTGFSIRVLFHEAMICGSAINGICEAVQKYIAAFSKDVQLKISDICLTVPNVITIENPKRPHYLHVEFNRLAKVLKEKAAVVYMGESYSYENLDNYSDQIAYALQAVSDVHQKVIAVCLERSYFLIALLLAIEKSGAICLTLDQAHPDEHINKILQEANPILIIADNYFINRLTTASFSNKALNADELRFNSNKERGNVKHWPVSHLVFTSGSTGFPKGIALKHEGLVNTIFSLKKRVDISSADIFFSVASVSFDMFIMDMWLPLLLGGTLVLPEERDIRIPEKIVDYIEKYRVSVIEATPSYLQSIVQHHSNAFPHKITILSGGEVLLPNLYQKLKNFGPIYNLYGPSENSVYTTVDNVEPGEDISIGYPLENVDLYILGADLDFLPSYAVGEIFIGGIGLMEGYIGQQRNESFKQIKIPGKNQTIKLYKTGDIGYVTGEGRVYYLNRADSQVKINGNRVDIIGVTNFIESLPFIEKTAIIFKNNHGSYGGKLFAYIILKSSSNANQSLKSEITDLLYKRFPYFMVPNIIFFVKSIPMTVNGKININELDSNIISIFEEKQKKNDVLDQVRDICCAVLEAPFLPIDVNFFEIGANSFSIARIVHEINNAFREMKLHVVDVYKSGNITRLSEQIRQRLGHIPVKEKESVVNLESKDFSHDAVAIIGVSCRFPEADNPEEFWKNIINSKVSIKEYAGHEDNDGFLPYCGFIESVDFFDNEFFNYSKSQAEKIDPQQRLFLQLCWEALEDSGYAGSYEAHSVGVFAGSGFVQNEVPHASEYKTENILSSLEKEKDFLTLRASYKLNFTGPSMSINTACSTSLVSVVKAYQSIVLGECDLALAGGISLINDEEKGYYYQPGSIFSKDGNYKVFDQDSSGIVPGSGGGVVVLKRLSQAEHDRDNIIGVILGGAVNNDGNSKVSFSAPSTSGQVSCIKRVLQQTGVRTDQLNYIETHGTGTLLGDSIELAALKEVLFSETRNKPCYIGSVKANIGHTNSAAGIAGLIKGIHIAKNKLIPGQINFYKPTALLQENSTLLEVPTSTTKLNDEEIFVGVSSFGMGGTNAHVVLKNFDKKVRRDHTSDTLELVVLSSRTKAGLKNSIHKLSIFIENNKPFLNISDIAHTLKVGRKQFQERFAVLATSLEDLVFKLNSMRVDMFEILENDSIFEKKIKEIARKWLLGEDIKWNDLEKNNTFSYKISLPTYSWEKTCFKYPVTSVSSVKAFNLFFPLEEKILEISKKIFNKNMNLDTEFSTFNMDSITALEFLSLLRKTYSFDINPIVFKQYTTPRALSAYLQKKTESTFENVALIKGGKSENYIFFIHPVGGTSFCYSDIIQSIDIDINIYTISDPDIYSDGVQFFSILDLAKRYYEIIKAIQPSGTYHLAGLSLGGVVAVEIARLILENKSTIGFVGLIESWGKLPNLLKDDVLFENIMLAQEKLIEDKLNQSTYFLDNKRWLELQRIRLNHLFEHPIKLFDFPVFLFKAKQVYSYFFEIDDPYNYWETYCTNTVIRHWIDGNHESIVYGNSGKTIALLVSDIISKRSIQE